MKKMIVPIAGFFLAGICTTSAANLVLVEKGVCRTPIVVASNAPPETLQAVKELGDYIKKISGASPEIVVGNADPTPTNAIWVGAHPKLADLFPKVKLDFQYPEEILYACNGQHVLIVGRDRMGGTNQVEFGTANSVYTFIEKKLDVRWLWPGPLGEDIIQRDTIAFSPFEYRFHPPFRQRHLWPQQPKEWHRVQRLLLYSLRFEGGESFEEWWGKYHERHPDYFALQPDGSRDAYPDPVSVKICVSNPNVWTQWLDNAEAAFRADPALLMVSANPNDGSTLGECVCTNCRAWDNTNGPPVTLYGKGRTDAYVALTDRYIKFWNILARGLKARFPDREVYVGACAYGPYRTPPVAEVLEKNIAIGYVGHFPLANDTVTRGEQASWLGWTDKTSIMVFRPNLFHYSGGWLGLPTLALRRTMKDFRFLADHKCVGLTIDTLCRCWATQGVEYYLMAQLAYDPRQDGEAVVMDYCRRGFGAAAKDVRKYFDLMERAHEAILDRIKHSSGAAREAILIYQDVYTRDVLDEADALMRRAEAKVAKGPEIFRQRVAFVRVGGDHTRLQVEIMREMKKVRESKGADGDAVRKAIELCARREALYKQSPDYAVAFARWYHEIHQLDDYMGPPSAAFRAGTNAAPAALPNFEGKD
jgi:hypothetical protein